MILTPPFSVKAVGKYPRERKPQESAHLENSEVYLLCVEDPPLWSCQEYERRSIEIFLLANAGNGS